MSDNKQWFKVWTSILIDQQMMCLSMEDRGRWLTLCALVAHNGNKGILKIKTNILAHLIHCDVTELNEKITLLPNVKFKLICNDTCNVTFTKWSKYQAFSESYERVKRYRDKQKSNVTVTGGVTGEEKRREQEEKRREYMDSFVLFWEKYPNRKAKSKTLEVWLKKIMPDNELLEKILLAIEQQKKTEAWTKNNGDYIPHPTTWLNGKRWEDEVTKKQNAENSPFPPSPFDEKGNLING